MKKMFLGLIALLGVMFISQPAVSSNGVTLQDVGEFITNDGGGVLTANVVLVQLWETELINKFRFEHSWVSRIPQKNQYVNNNIINLQEIGVDPNVLIDNTAYPIATNGRTDNTLPIALHLYETENTKIPYQELTALPYDKEGSVIRQHRETLEEKVANHGLHSLAPAANSAATPIVETTGGDNGNGRKRLVSADVIKLKERFDNLGVPRQGRVLVLASAHVNDLLVEDLSFRQRFQNTAVGAISPNYYGFEVYEDQYNPVYDAANAKKAFGAAPAGTDRIASTAFYTPRTVRARGDVRMFFQAANSDPANRQTVVGFSLYHVILPQKAEAIGAIVSDDLL